MRIRAQMTKMTLGFREIIELSAPQYLLLSLLSPTAAYMIVAQQIPTLPFLSVVVALSFLVLGFNAANMIFDADLDAYNKPKRPIPSGKTKKSEAAVLATLFYIAGLIVGLTVNFQFMLLLIAFIIVSVIYSMPPLRLRNYWWGSSIAGAVLYGIVPFLSAEVFAGKILSQPIFLAFFTALIIIISNTKDLEDTIGEKKMGVSSLPVLLGEQTTAYIVIGTNFLLIVLMAVLAGNGSIPKKYLSAALVSLAIFALASLAFLKDVREIRAKNYITEKIKQKNEFNDALQSEAVTISVFYAIAVQLIFGAASLQA